MLERPRISLARSAITKRPCTGQRTGTGCRRGGERTSSPVTPPSLGTWTQRLIEIVIFKRHSNVDLSDCDNEAKLIEILEDLIVGKTCEIHYNHVSDQKNVAIKVTIT